MRVETFYLKEAYPFLEKEGCNPKVELFLQTNSGEIDQGQQKHPLLIVCPGGGYCYTSDRESDPIAMEFMMLGYHVAAVRYSVAPNGHYPQQLLEVGAAIDYLFKHAEAWQIDTSRVAIMGFSAGAHLAANYTNAYMRPEVQSMLPARGVNACILSYGVLGCEKPHLGSYQSLLDKEVLTSEDWEKHTPSKQVTPNTPPTFLWHSVDDDCVPVENALEYAHALSANKVSYALHIFHDGWHGISTCDYKVGAKTGETLSCRQWLPLCRDWLSRVLPDPS